MSEKEISDSINLINMYVLDVLASRKMKSFSDITQYLSWMNRGKYISSLEIKAIDTDDRHVALEFFLCFGIVRDADIRRRNNDSTFQIKAFEHNGHGKIVEDKTISFRAFNQFAKLNMYNVEQMIQLFENSKVQKAYHEYLELIYDSEYKF